MASTFMLIRCPSCGEHSSDDAAFCSGCGAALHVLAPSARVPPSSATGPTVKLAAPSDPVAPRLSISRASISPGVLPVAGLLFTVLFVFGLAYCLARGKSDPPGLWLIGVLVAGALVAQRAWLDGQLWRGLCGMALWGGMIWLLAADSVVPWGAALLLGWLLLRLLGRLDADVRTQQPQALER